MKIIMNKRKDSGRRNYSRRNPKRGPPGILLFCETGRERKCHGEAVEILNHYFQRDVAIGNDEIQDSAGGEKKKKVLTLDEEIQMMKKENKTSSFQEYDTGCKGVVFIMFTAKDCNNIVKDIANDEVQNDKDENGLESKASSEFPVQSPKERQDNKRKHEEEADKSVQSKKQKLDPSTATSANRCIWDPIQTVQSVVNDIRNKDTTAPRSRFITKMIPIQATCYANMEEMEATVKVLLQNYLMPIGIKSFEKRNDTPSKPISTNHEIPAEELKLPTFKVELRKRFCSHMKRDDVIQLVANSVQSFTSEYWNARRLKEEKESKDEIELKDSNIEEEKQQHIVCDEKKCPELFSVDLTNPDYTIVIEVCRTLCTMAVVKDTNSLKQFNLIKIQEDASQKDD